MKKSTRNIHSFCQSLRLPRSLLAVFLPLALILWPAAPSAQESAPVEQSANNEEQGLIDYYISGARAQLEVSDIRKISEPFSVIVVVRQYTIDYDGDTLQLDTALVKFRYNLERSERDQVPDTLHADSLEILQSSFLSGEPETLELFLPAPWERGAELRLLPDEPSSGELALEILPDSSGGSSISSGLFLLERGSGGLTYALEYQEGTVEDRRYSRETRYQTVEGFLAPASIVEHRMERALFSNSYFVIESRVITLRFD